MLRLGDKVRFSQAALKHDWQLQSRKPVNTAIGRISSIRQTDNKQIPNYQVTWEDEKSYGVTGIWAEEWLELVAPDEIGAATEKWEHYFGEENEQ